MRGESSGKGPHVLLIHQLFVTGDEAGGTRHFELSKSLIDEGYTVSVVSSPVSYLSGQRAASIDPDLPDGMSLTRCPVYSPKGGSFFGRVLSFLSFMVLSLFAGLRVRNVDVVWGTTPPIFQAPTAWLIARLKRVPFVLEVRDLWPDFAVELGVLKNPILIRIAKALERFLYRSADLLVVNSPGFVEHICREGGHRERIILVANGVDPAGFDPEADGSHVREEFGLGDRFVSLYAGAHGIPNDLEVVLRAAREAEAEDGVFLFVGAGRDYERLQGLAAEWALGNVIFAGVRPKSEMRDYLAAADVCIAILQPLPLFNTTYPNKVFDYMAAGRPVVLAIDGVIRAVVEEAGAGTYVAPGDPEALLQAVRAYRLSPELAQRHGSSGRTAAVHRFHRALQAQHLEEALSDLIAP